MPLVIENISKKIQDKQVLENVSFELNQGEMVPVKRHYLVQLPVN